jgi:hypothetical protein
VIGLNQNALVILTIPWHYMLLLQICIPYLDPAMLQTRQQVFQLTYGFKCTCPSCNFFSARTGDIPNFPSHSNESTALERRLGRFIFSSEEWASGVTWKQPTWENGNTPPDELLPLLQESYLTSLAERFSSASHDGPYSQALDDGYTLLALYLLIYPPNYPQIGESWVVFRQYQSNSLLIFISGMHALEVAKTAWNAFIVGGDVEERKIDQVVWYLALARRILSIFGREGDAGGPLDEIESLQRLINDV